jgi:diguanylate cyclase (GGDEF)-like protein
MATTDPRLAVAQPGSSARGRRRWASGGASTFVAAYVAVYLIALIWGWGGDDTGLLVRNVAFGALTLFAAASMVLASARATDRATALAWRWLAASTACITSAVALIIWYQATSRIAPFPSAIDACYLLSYPLFVTGLLRFPTSGQSRANRTRLLVDAATVAVSAVSVVWFLVIGPTLADVHQPLLNGVVASAYPVGDVVLLFAAAYVLLRAPAASTRRALGLLIAGLACTVVGDVANGWFLLHSTESFGLVVDIAFVVGVALYAVAPHTPGSATESDLRLGGGDGVAHRASRVRWMPYVAAAVVLGLLVGAQFGAPLYQRVGLALCAATVAGLVLLRQFLAQSDLLSAQGLLSHRALHDALTGLPNRVLVLDRTEQLLARARREMRRVAVLYIDIDGFKHVNDTFGHPAGDELLRAIAARMSSVVRESDTVARMGGDEFVILLDSTNADVDPELAAERLLEVLRQPVELDAAGGRRVVVTASIGIALGRDTTADELLRDADMALYAAKEAGKDRFVEFETSMQTAAHDRLLLEMDLREAADSRQLFLLYQPTFDLQTEAIRGVEALVRWSHPTRGVMMPDEFIGLAEASGLIVPIGRWVLGEACRQAADWQAGGRAIGMSVNVSGRQLDDDGIVEDVRSVLADTGLDPAMLTLEVTETALMRDPDSTARRLQTLKELGVRLAIDDFGTGYSSMAYLRQFPVDAVKIDQAFISGIAASKESAALVHTLVQLGKTLNLETLGEGIEEASQLRNLQDERCDLGQGFLFARPLPAAEIERFLDQATTVLSRRGGPA